MKKFALPVHKCERKGQLRDSRLHMSRVAWPRQNFAVCPSQGVFRSAAAVLRKERSCCTRITFMDMELK